jgi:hypothetical protein
MAADTAAPIPEALPVMAVIGMVILRDWSAQYRQGDHGTASSVRTKNVLREY